MSKQTPVPLEFEGEELEGVFVGRRDGQARPTVMLIPTVMGVSDLELGLAADRRTRDARRRAASGVRTRRTAGGRTRTAAR